MSEIAEAIAFGIMVLVLVLLSSEDARAWLKPRVDHVIGYEPVKRDDNSEPKDRESE